MGVDSTAIWRHIDTQRSELAELLDGLTEQQWSTPSLCAGWTVRDVAAHLTHSVAAPATVLAAAVRTGFRFNAMMDHLVRADRRTPAELTAALRGMAGARRRPPGTTELDPLMDALVHGQDIAIPLGIDRQMPGDAAVAVAHRLWGMRFPFRPARQFAGTRFVATDTEFTVGHGTPVALPIAQIVLIFVGRRTPISAAAGPASDTA